MFLQIEITTRCQFKCDYCAGRHMEQKDMPFETFKQLITDFTKKYGQPSEVFLQGEGEPTLHPQFFDMVNYLKPIRSSIITNGMYHHPEHFVGLLDHISVSIDSLDENTSSKIGRYNVERAMNFVDYLSKHMTVTVMTVDYGQDLSDLKLFVSERKVGWAIQKLQTKPDYSNYYKKVKHNLIVSDKPQFNCFYVKNNNTRFFNIDMVELPCCFIKDATNFNGIDDMKTCLGTSNIPTVCTGCKFIG